MNASGKFRHLILAALLASSLAACGGGTTDDKLGRFLVAPNKYVLYTCPQLADAVVSVAAREKVLEDLMQKAGKGAGGRVASTLAYEPEYAQLRGDMDVLRRTAAEKGCKPAPAAAAPTPAAPAPAAPAKRASDKKAR